MSGHRTERNNTTSGEVCIMRSSRLQVRYLIGFIAGSSVALLGLMLALHYGMDIPIGDLTRDPAGIGRIPPYSGAFSQISLFLWTAAAALCALGAVVLSGEESQFPLRNFLLCSGLLSAVMLMDDAFMLHEFVLPRMGIPQLVVLGIYAATGLAYLLHFLRLILKTDYILLGIAFTFLGLSVCVDVFECSETPLYFWDDGPKLVGLIAWATYFFQTVRQAVQPRITSC